jgi:hypothetical protein
MARRRDLDRIYQARRAGIVARLVSTGVLAERAEALMAAWESEATASGLAPDSAAYWDRAWPWLEPQRWAKGQHPSTPSG